MPRPLRIAQVAPPLEPVPPPAYGGTERIVGELVEQLHARGHEVTTFASGDSLVSGRLVPTVPEAVWRSDFVGDPSPWFSATIQRVLEHATEFDLIHSHLEWYSPLLARAAPVPVVTTFHGRLDLPWAPDLLRAGAGRHVAISRAQAASRPEAPWAAVVHNGLSLRGAPFVERPGDDLAFVGRMGPEKGIIDAITVALQAGRRLRIAAKAGRTAVELDFLEAVFKPALERAGSSVEWLGEVSRMDRDRLFAESFATLMPGAWPEPFGLVAIESLACGTPIVARAAGALPEIVRHGVDGFLGRDSDELVSLVDRVAELDRAAIRTSVLDRFSAERMTDGYERLYREVVEPAPMVAGRGDRRFAPILVVSGEPAHPEGPASPARPGQRPDATSESRARG